MRIAVVSPHLPTKALPMRGVSHDEQLRLFAEAGHEVRAVVPLPWSVRRWLAGTRIPDEECDGPVVVVHPHYPRVPHVWRGPALAVERRLFARAARAALNAGVGAAELPDVVLAHSVSLPGGLLGRIGGATFVVSLYDHELYDWAPKSGIVRDAIVRTLRSADCAVYLSDALRRYAVELAGPHRNVVIPLGIDTDADVSQAPPPAFTVSTVTRLIPRKRVDHLIRAFARLAAERSDARLVIVGDGPERPMLIRLVQALGLGEKVEFTGELDRGAARERIVRSNVMALPSVRESLGAVYLEAMALGVPALGTRGEGIEEHIEHGVSGILVPPGDDEVLFAELRALAVDRDRARRIGVAGRRRFLAGPFSWRANVQAYLALFEELWSGRGRGRATHTT
ncbi:MAG TPA: glycosyltransferase [Gemmatimonadales bacterium]|nr:glycosyltransferase [Gemmatimonadales bacterium]